MSLLEVHLEIFRRCYLKCIHCSASNPWEEEPVSIKISDWQTFLGIRDPSLRFIVCFTGGEPLICPDILTWVKKTRDTGRIESIGLFTSGVILSDEGSTPEPLSKQLAAQMRHEGVDFCYISLYSECAETHDQITGIQGAHETALESIKRLIATGIEVRVHYVPMKCTINELPEFVLFLEKHGITELRFLRLAHHGRAVQSWNHIGLEASTQRAQAVELIRTRGRSSDSVRITVAGFPDLMDCRPFPTGSRCQAGRGLLYIDWQGDVYPCACAKNSADKVIMNLSLASAFHLWAPRALDPRVECLQDQRLY